MEIGNVYPQDNLQEVHLLGHNGWKMWEGLPRSGKPRHRWRKTWMDHPSSKPDDEKTDITGYADGVAIGRVFQLEAIKTKDIWFWVLNPPIDKIFWRPGNGSGWENSMAEAARRVEWCHEQMMQCLINFPQYARER